MFLYKIFFIRNLQLLELTLVITDNLEMESKIRYHMPISVTRCPTGLLYIVNNFFASNRISKTLFNNAKNGANGNAATKIVTNPYCNTVI